jgi:hypothetical protein
VGTALISFGFGKIIAPALVVILGLAQRRPVNLIDLVGERGPVVMTGGDRG